jgi:hypothetical protein
VVAASVVAGDAALEVDGTSSVIGENDPVMVDISTFTTTKILNKRSSPYGVEYRCELEPLWLPADLVKEVQMGCVHVRSYEKGLVRAARLDTLRKGTQKRKHSQI